MKLSDKQRLVKEAFYDDEIRHIIAYGAARSGKTSSTVWSFIDWARNFNGSAPFGLAAFSVDQFNDAILKEFKSYCSFKNLPWRQVGTSIYIRNKKVER